MTIPKKYFQDRAVLLILSVNVFLTLLASLTVLFRLSDVGGHGFIVQYRGNLGVSGFQSGSVVDLIDFIIFAVLVFVIHVGLSLRVYDIRRQLAVVVLALGSLLLIVSTIVGNALLALR